MWILARSCVCVDFQCREKEAIRLCLKYFRQKNLVDVYQQLQTQTSVTLEHPVLTELHTELVSVHRTTH